MVKIKVATPVKTNARPSKKTLRWQDYTTEPGPHGRGDPTHLWDCTCCLDGSHQDCEKLDMIFCRCWREKHTTPPAKNRARKPQPYPDQVERRKAAWAETKSKIVEEDDEFVFEFDDD